MTNGKVGMMNGVPSMTKLLGLGVVLAVAACSAEASSPPPNKGNGNNNGNGGSSLLPVAGTTNTGTGGSTANTGTGGTSSTGTAGTTATGTAGSAPGTAGTGGGGALAACPTPPAAGTTADLLIDDLEDKDNGVAKIGGRSGYWYTYLDKLGSTIMPVPAPPALMPGSTDCHGGMACIIVSGTTPAADTVAATYPYAGVGFDFSNAMKPCVYDGTAYTGIKFWARGDAQIRIKLNIPTTTDETGGGTCTGSCNNGHGADVILSPTWTEVNLPFATIAPEPGWGPMPPPAFTKGALLSLQIQFPPGQTFSAAFDDFTFY